MGCLPLSTPVFLLQQPWSTYCLKPSPFFLFTCQLCTDPFSSLKWRFARNCSNNPPSTRGEAACILMRCIIAQRKCFSSPPFCGSAGQFIHHPPSLHRSLRVSLLQPETWEGGRPSSQSFHSTAVFRTETNPGSRKGFVTG